MHLLWLLHLVVLMHNFIEFVVYSRKIMIVPSSMIRPKVKRNYWEGALDGKSLLFSEALLTAIRDPSFALACNLLNKASVVASAIPDILCEYHSVVFVSNSQSNISLAVMKQSEKDSPSRWSLVQKGSPTKLASCASRSRESESRVVESASANK